MRVPVLDATLNAAGRGLLSFLEKRFHPRGDAPEWFLQWLGHKSGEAVVTHASVLGLSAVYTAVRILAETIAQVPLNVYRRLPNGGREVAGDHPLNRILHDQPNADSTSFQWREAGQGHLGLWGNHYSLIIGSRMSITELVPLLPDRMSVRRIGGMLRYFYTPEPGMQTIEYPAERILHIPWFGTDAVCGYDPVAVAKRALGTYGAVEEQASAFFQNGMAPGGVLRHPTRFKDKAAQNRVRESWEEVHQGPSKAGKVAILEEGMDYTPIGISPQLAELLSTRKFQVNDVARFYNIPEHMLNFLENASFNNVEEMNRNFIRYSMNPWYKRWEQALTTKLLGERERQEFFIEFNVEGLLRGDIATRYEAYSTGIQNGFLNKDEARGKENLPAIPGGAGQVFVQQLNLAPIGAEAFDDDDGGPEDDELDQRRIEHRAHQPGPTVFRNRVARAFVPAVQDAFARVLRREKADVMRQVEKIAGQRNENELDAFLETFYAEHREFVAGAARPVYEGLIRQTWDGVSDELGVELADSEFDRALREYIDNLAAGYSADSLGQLRGVLRQTVEQNQPAEPAVRQRFEEWTERRPGKLAREETIRAVNAIAVAGYRASGAVTRLRWVAFGSDSCPYCRELDGRIVGIDDSFAPAGGDVQPEGRRPLRQYRAVKHPPLHAGCICQLIRV